MLKQQPAKPARPTGRHQGPTAAPRRETAVVIGNGMVGFRFCQQLVANDTRKRYGLVVFGEEPRPAYDRVHLSAGFNGTDPESLCLAGREWYENQGIELYVADPVVAIDRERREVESRRGVRVRYDRLVFATGAAPRMPSIEGVEHEGVFAYRTIDDLRRIRSYSMRCRRVAVVGGGLLGLEAAKALHDRGLETHVIEFAGSLLVRQLNVVAAERLRTGLEELGVRVHLGKDTRGIAADGNERILHFADGGTLAVDMVVFAIGIRPRDELAAACGIPCGIHGGIKIDERLRTGDERVYAIGECALLGGLFYGFVSPGYRMAEVLVGNLLGRDQTFVDFDFSTRLKVEGLEVNVVGDPWSRGESISHSVDGAYRQIVVNRGRLAGVAVVGTWPELGRLKDTYRTGRRLSRRQLARFRKKGRIWPVSSRDAVLSWPSGAVVCECLGVTLGELKAARGGGDSTVAALREATGASSVCGSCEHLLARIAGDDAVSPGSRERGLLVASLVAVGAVVVTILARPVPFSDSVRAGRIDILWRDSFWKQFTGYALVIICASSLLLSLRKRWRRLSVGSYRGWRTVHGALGASTLLFLFFHTGFRLGMNLNFALSTAFLALALLGGVAGLAVAGEGRFAGWTSGARALLTRVHVFLFWPTVVLILFHVVAIYYF